MQHVDMVNTLAGISEIIFLFGVCLLFDVNCLLFYCEKKPNISECKFNPAVRQTYATTAALVSGAGCRCEKYKRLSDVSIPLSLGSLAAFKTVGCFTLDLQLPTVPL